MNQNPDEVDRAMLGGDRLGDQARIPTWQIIVARPLPPVPAEASLAAACQWPDPPIGGNHLVEDRRVLPKLMAWLTRRWKRNAG